MASNSSIVLTNLDYDTYRDQLQQYLKSQDVFKDVDFDGSNIGVLLDLLSYNTYTNGFYLNMVGSEMFLDSAQLRDSIVSHAKELNYTPRSFSSAVATINLIVTSNNSSKTSLYIPKGTKFTSKVGSSSFIFSTNENMTITGDGTFTANNISIYEGTVVQETFVSNSPMILSNERVDIGSLNITVVEDNGSTVLPYSRALSLFDLDENSKVFFVQGSTNNRYEIIMGDGIVGRKPKDNSLILVEYRISSGELPNGASTFSPIGSIDSETDIDVFTVSNASGGSVAESDDSIRYNAPRHFTTQERAVTTEDYENLLRINFPEINAVTAYGGEDLNPPVFGKVFIAIDLKDIESLPRTLEDTYYSFLKSRATVSISPVFTNPDRLYLQISSTLNYNINQSKLSLNDIRSLVTSQISTFAQDNLNSFNKKFRYSRLVEAIDESDASIISNETSVIAYKKVNIKDLVEKNITINYGFPITSFESSLFSFRGKQSKILASNGILSIYSGTDKVTDIGTIDMNTGVASFNKFQYDSIQQTIKFYVSASSLDIESTNNTIISILDSDIALIINKVDE